MFESKDVKPLLLKEIKEPFNNDNYLYELKYDGIRAIIYVSAEELVIKSRNGKEITHLYPELQEIQKLVKNKRVIFDGEIVILEQGKPSFQKLQTRSKFKKIQENNDKAVFVCFDILFQNKELIDMPLEKRKDILDKYCDNEVFIKSKIFNEGMNLFKIVQDFDLEGIVAKEKHSLYVPGKRLDSWLKIKNFKKEYFYVHGYILNKEKYSLCLGEYRGKKLYFVGKVSVATKSNLIKKLKQLKKVQNKFVNFNEEVEYIEPKEKVLVKFIERTENKMLRELAIEQEKT